MVSDAIIFHFTVHIPENHVFSSPQADCIHITPRLTIPYLDSLLELGKKLTGDTDDGGKDHERDGRRY